LRPQFEETIISTCNEIAQILIEKNKEYGDSYRQSRLNAEESYGSRKVPFDFHAGEKLARYRHTDDEDSVLDLAGYSVLELVCRRLDDAS
jgi:hypothetical protein